MSCPVQNCLRKYNRNFPIIRILSHLFYLSCTVCQAKDVAFAVPEAIHSFARRSRVCYKGLRNCFFPLVASTRRYSPWPDANCLPSPSRKSVSSPKAGAKSSHDAPSATTDPDSTPISTPWNKLLRPPPTDWPKEPWPHS